MSYIPLIESADSMQDLSGIEINPEDELIKLVSDKKTYIKNTIDTYFDSESNLLIDEAEYYQVYYGILYATTREDIIDAFNSPTVDVAKKFAKRAIDETAGENQSLLMQKLVKVFKQAIHKRNICTLQDGKSRKKPKKMQMQDCFRNSISAEPPKKPCIIRVFGISGSCSRLADILACARKTP